jgi:ubiquinone/menaquinone biosynthesis C-methylase UbiE
MTGTDYADTYDPDTDFDRYYTVATARRIAERICPWDHVLELGCATGLMTSVILNRATPQSWLGLDRSPTFLDRARDRQLSRTTFDIADLDDLDIEALGLARFDHVVATNVLHELADPLEFLRRCARLLTQGGVIHLTLQNPLSIHRLAALEMGLITSLTEVSERGGQWGTTALWTANQLEDLAAEAGLTVRAREGIMLKPLPNRLMDQLPENVIEGFIRSAVYLPDSCAMNYLVLGNPVVDDGAGDND